MIKILATHLPSAIQVDGPEDLKRFVAHVMGTQGFMVIQDPELEKNLVPGTQLLVGYDVKLGSCTVRQLERRGGWSSRMHDYLGRFSGSYARCPS